MDGLYSIVGIVVNTVCAVQQAADRLSTLCDQISKESKEPIDLRMKVLIFELESAVSKLSEWQKLWTPEDVKSEAYYVLIWGQSGQRDIEARLKDIEHPAKSISDQADALKEALQVEAKSTQKRSPGNWLRWLLSLPSSQGRGHTARDRLNKSATELVSNVNELLISADTHFRSMHATTKKAESNSDRLSNIMQSRRVSEVIYEKFQQDGLDLDLDLNLLNNDQDIDTFPDIFDWSDLSLTYHFFFANENEEVRTRHLTLEETTDHNSTSPQACTEDGTVVYNSLNSSNDISEQEFLWRLATHAGTSSIQLRGERFTSDDSRASRFRSLSSILDGSTDNQKSLTRPHTTAQKIKLAYQIVESSLFLLGTPWLSHLSAVNLRGNGGFETDGQYSLRIEMSEPPSHPPSGAQSLERSQIRMIGALLGEIALGSPWLSDDADSQRELNLKEIEKRMGWSYKQACEYCVSVTNEEQLLGSGEHLQQPLESSEGLIGAFYSKVFLSIRDSLHNIM